MLPPVASHTKHASAARNRANGRSKTLRRRTAETWQASLSGLGLICQPMRMRLSRQIRPIRPLTSPPDPLRSAYRKGGGFDSLPKQRRYLLACDRTHIAGTATMLHAAKKLPARQHINKRGPLWSLSSIRRRDASSRAFLKAKVLKNSTASPIPAETQPAGAEP